MVLVPVSVPAVETEWAEHLKKNLIAQVEEAARPRLRRRRGYVFQGLVRYENGKAKDESSQLAGLFGLFGLSGLSGLSGCLSSLPAYLPVCQPACLSGLNWALRVTSLLRTCPWPVIKDKRKSRQRVAPGPQYRLSPRSLLTSSGLLIDWACSALQAFWLA